MDVREERMKEERVKKSEMESNDGEVERLMGEMEGELIRRERQELS